MIRSYDDLIRTADAYSDSRTLITGIELKVFTHIGRKGLTAPAVARRARTSQEGMDLLLHALTGMGLLTQRGNRFYNTPLARTYLDARHPRSITNFLWLAGEHWEDWMGLTKAVRSGRKRAAPQPKDDPIFRKKFAKALHERSLYISPRLIRPLKLGRAQQLLDLGGGAGSYALALLRKTPGLKATVFDRPAAVRVALAEAARAGLSHRFSVIGGDLFQDAYGGPYDVVFFSNVIHIYGPEENRRILRKIKRAMRPGGRLIIVEYFLDRDRAHPPEVSSFALMMLLFTQSGRCYTWEEVTGWLRAHGFSDFRKTRVTEKIGILQCTLAR